ncbi:uncharacterized protein LOC117110081 [Anneissia japonica]|uniref:uncharacterized protein LOC117110081 n=1 Tax=Anneissia japonica TaxID=1529436 RepID=UPI001425AF72|nr:uncharacterized protein LOC117110081 [Anneissia japonica]
MEEEKPGQPSSNEVHATSTDPNFYFDDIVYFKEENCIISNCSNHSPDKCRQSKFLLFPVRPEWKEIIASQVDEEVNLDQEDVRICGKHFAEPAAEDLAPSLFGFETLREHAGIPFRAQKWCCIKNCSNGYQKYSGTTTSIRKPAVYYPLAKLADDDVGRSLMKDLLAKVNGIEDHSSFICHLHLKVLHIDDEVTDAANSKNKGKSTIRYTSNKYNIKLDCNLDTTDKSCCIIPTCVFADKRTVYSMGDKQWRPSMFPFPSLHRQPVPRMIWLRLVREAMPEDLKQFCPSVTSKLCGLHFPDGKPTLANPDPTRLEKRSIFSPELDISLVKSQQKEHAFDLSTSTASDALKKAVELRGLVEDKLSNTIHSNAVKPSVAHDEIDIESDDDLDNRLQECQQLMEEDSEDDSEEETDDASENDSDDEMQEGSDKSNCSSSQDSFQTMGRKLKRFFRYKDWINAMRVLEKITENFNETFVGTADEDRVFVSVDRKGTEQNCTKEPKTEALQYVKEHFLQEQDWSQLDLMLKHFDIIEDMPPVETSDESDASSEEEDEGSDAAERSLLLSLSKKFRYHLKSLEWTKADKTLNRVTLVFFEAVIMDSCSSKPGKKLKEEVSRRQSFKTAELKAVEHLRKQMDSINEQKLMNEMLKLFGRHSAVSKSFISPANVIHTPLRSEVQHQPALKPKLQTSTIAIKPSVAKTAGPTFQSSQLMKEIKAMESELMVAASKVEAKKVSDILKQIGIRLIAVDKKISIQQVEKDYEEISSPMELKQKALQYLKQHGILCQVKNERNQTSLSSTPTKHHTRQTTILHDTIKAIETPKENTNVVIYQEVTSGADHVATSMEQGVKRKYADELQVDKNALQTIYVHFNIKPPKKRKKMKTSINGSKTLTAKSSSINDDTTAQQFNQPIPMEKNVPNNEETVVCFESGSQDCHIKDFQDNKEKLKGQNDGGIEKSQEELCMDTHENMKHLQNDKETLKEQDEVDVENNSQEELCMDTDEKDMTQLQDDKETLKPQNEVCIENKSQEELCMDTVENDLKRENSLEDKSIENHLEANLKEDELSQAPKVSPKKSIPEECPEKKTIIQDLEKHEDHQLSEIENRTEEANVETTDNSKDISSESKNKKFETILDSKTGVFTKQDDINKDVMITTVPDNDDKKHETILDAKTGAWVKQLKDSSELSVNNFKESSSKEIDNVSGIICEDIQYIVTFDATNFKRWKLLTKGELEITEENIIETKPSSPILSNVIKGAIDSDLPSLVYQAKSSGKQLTSVDQKVSRNEINADVNVDQIQPIDNVSSNVFEGMASGYPGYTASTTLLVKRIPVFAFYNEFRPWLLFPFGRALRKLLLCTPIRMGNQKDKPTKSDENQFVIDLTDVEMKKAVQELAKVLGKWEKVKDVNTYSDGIKVVVNDLLKTSESGIFWNMFVESFIEAVDKELPNIIAQCEEEIKRAKDTKETKLQVVAKESGTNPPPPPPLKHGPSMQPKGKVSTFSSMPELSHCSNKQPSIAMPTLKPGISSQIQQGQGVTISMPPRLVGPFTSNRTILNKGTTGQQVQTQPPSNMVSVKISNSNIILLPTSQGKTQFVVGNSPVTTVNAQPVSQSQVFQINCASNQTSSTSGGSPIILNQSQLTNAKVTQNQVKSVSAGQSVRHLMVPVTVPGLQKGYVMFVPHTVNLSTTSQTPVSTVSSLTPSPAVQSNTSQPVSSTIPLVPKPQDVDAEDKQGIDKRKELMTDDNLIKSKMNPERTTSSNLSESILLQKSQNSAITKCTENHNKNVQLDNNGKQINRENLNDHGNDEMEVVYQPEKLSSICKQVLKKINNEEDLSEASLHDEEPDEGSGSSSDSNSPPDKPSNNNGTPEHKKSSEKKPNTKPFQHDERSNEGETNLSVNHMKSDPGPSCISKSTSSILQLLSTPSLISNASPSSACYAPVQQFKDPMIFINRVVPGQAAPLPFLVMQTHKNPRPLLMKTSEDGQRDITAISPIASSQLFKESKKLNVPYLTPNKKQETSSTISSGSNISNSMDDIKSSDLKKNTTIPRSGSLHLEYLKFWNSQFQRFEDLGVQKYKEECKLHTKLHQLLSITKRIHNHVSDKFNRKKSDVHGDDQTKYETMPVKGTLSPVCSDKAQSSKQLSGDGSTLEMRSVGKEPVEEKYIENKCNDSSCVETKELEKKDKTLDDDKNIVTAPAILKNEADNIHTFPANSTSESNQSEDCDKKINNDEKCTPDKVSTLSSLVISATVANGSNERTRSTSEHPQIVLDEVDKISNNLHHPNNLNPNNSLSDSLCDTKKDLKELCDSGCTCNVVQMYVCDNCLEVFSSMEDLNKHVIIHLSTEKVLPMFSCERCELNFTSKKACDCHKESHEDLKWNRCSWCGMMFNLVENLENHLLVHYDVNNEQIYECKCSRLFIGLKTIRMHMEDHFPEKTDKKHQCNQCTASFHFVKNMKKHTEDVHNMPSDRWLNVHWRCHKCLSNSTSIHRLNAHMEDHNDKTEFTCGKCPKSFQYFLDYIMHCMNHCEDRVSSIFNCPICDGLFGIDIKTHIKQHLSGMKKCQFCLRFFATSHGLNKHLTEKHKTKIAEKQKTKIAEKHKFKMNTEHTPTPNNRDSGAADAVEKPLTNQTKPKSAECKEGQYCSVCGTKLGIGNFDHPICSTCAKDCLDCPFTCGAKFSNQRHLTSHLVAHHMERKKHDPLLFVCPHCQTSCRNAGTMALHWIKHCTKNKKRLEMNNNTDKWLEKIEVLETIPALQIFRKHKKKKRKHVDHDDETYTKFKKKKKHKKSKRRVGHKVPQRPYVKLDSHKKHRYKYSGLESHKEHKSMYSGLVPKLSPRQNKHEITCGSEVKCPANYSITAEPTKRNRKKRVYEDMIAIPRSVLLPKFPVNIVGTKQHLIKDMVDDNIKKPRRTSRISKPKEFPDYEEDIDKALRNNQAFKKQKVETSKSQKKTNAVLKSEKETVKPTKPNRTSFPVTDEESDSDIDVYETHQESSPVKDRVRPSNLRPRINSGHKWDLFHVDTILSTIDKLKLRLGRKNRSKDSDVNKKLLKKGKLLQKKILQMKDGKCSRKRNVKILTTQQIVALDHCYLGLPKFMSKKKKGPVYAAPIDHDYVIGPRMDPSLEAEKDLAKKRNESMEENKELTKERLNMASKVKSKKSPKREDQLSASAQISQIAASLKKDSTFRPEERMAGETDFDDIVQALLDIGCSTSGSEHDTDDRDLHNVTGESNLDNDLVDFLADMVSIEENENNEEEGDDNLMNVDLSINDSAILDGLSDLDGNTSGSQEQIDWIPIGNIQQDEEVNMSNENETFFQISNTIDILSQEPCCEDNKNQLNLKNIPDTQEEAFVSNLRPQDVEHVLDIIADKMVQNNCNVEDKEQQMHLDLNINNYADSANSGLHFPDSSSDKQKEVSNSKSNKVNIDNEQNRYINNEHELCITDGGKTLGICSEVSLSVSTDETSECSLRDEKLLSVSSNDGALNTRTEECSVPADEKMNKIKEIFGSFPTQMNVENSRMFVDIQKPEDIEKKQLNNISNYINSTNSELPIQGNFSEDQSKVSDSTSNKIYEIHHEQNCDIINEHESDVFNVGKDLGICAEVSLSVSANDETSETINEECSLPADGKSRCVSTNGASKTSNEECHILPEDEKSHSASANDKASETINEECFLPEDEVSHSVSANDEASETINGECSLQADEKSDSVSTNDEALETSSERCLCIADEKMNKIKEIFGSLPTQMNMERSCISVDVQKKDGVDKIQSELLSGSTEKLRDSGVFMLSDNEVEGSQV